MSKKQTQQTKQPMAHESSATKKQQAISEKQTQKEILHALALETGLTLKAVKSVFVATAHLAQCHLGKHGSGEFTLPEIGIKILRKVRAATQERAGRNPSTGETIMLAARPAQAIIRIKPLKRLKDVVV